MDFLDPTYRSGDPNFSYRIAECSKRSILLSEKHDYVIVNSQSETSYLHYLNAQGLEVGSELVASGNNNTLVKNALDNQEIISKLKDLQRNRECSLVPYMGGALEHEFARVLSCKYCASDYDLVAQLNSKVWFKNYLQSLALDRIEGEIARKSEVAAKVSQALSLYSEVVVRGDRSIGGSSVWIIKNRGDLSKFLDMLSYIDMPQSFLIEKRHTVIHSPNIQFYIDTLGIRELGLTDQLISNSLAHGGNIYPLVSPLVDEIRRTARVLAEKIQAMGYLGYLGIDFIIDSDYKAYPIELNARTNTSTFPLILLQRLFDGREQNKYFKLLNRVSTDGNLAYSGLAKTMGQDLLYSNVNGEGVFPYNVGCLPWGECDFLMVGDSFDQVENMWKELSRKMKVSNAG